MLESKVASLTQQLDAQYELHRTVDRKAKHSEAQLLDLEDRLRRAEGELCAGDVLRDGMRMDKDRVRAPSVYELYQTRLQFPSGSCFQCFDSRTAVLGFRHSYVSLHIVTSWNVSRL